MGQRGKWLKDEPVIEETTTAVETAVAGAIDEVDAYELMMLNIGEEDEG